MSGNRRILVGSRNCPEICALLKSNDICGHCSSSFENWGNEHSIYQFMLSTVQWVMQGIQWKDVYEGQESNCPGLSVQCECRDRSVGNWVKRVSTWACAVSMPACSMRRYNDDSITSSVAPNLSKPCFSNLSSSFPLHRQATEACSTLLPFGWKLMVEQLPNNSQGTILCLCHKIEDDWCT